MEICINLINNTNGNLYKSNKCDYGNLYKFNR